MARKCTFCGEKLVKDLCPQGDLNGKEIASFSEEELKEIKKQHKKMLRKQRREEKKEERKLERKIERAERRAKRKTERRERRKEKWREMTGKQKAISILIRFIIFAAFAVAAYFGVQKLLGMF